LNGAPAFFVGSDIIIPPDNTNELVEIAALSLTPNPIADKATLVFDLSEKTTLSIDVLSANGQIVQQIAPQSYAQGQQRVAFDLSNLPSGVYAFKIYNESGSTFVKGIK